MPFVTGNKIAIINVYDGCITLTDAPTIFSDYTVNGVSYSSVNDLQSALLDVIYTRNSLTNAAITLTTIGNSGAATLTGITLNIPNYTLAGLGGVGGTGTTNFLPKFTGGSTLGNSAIFENGGNVGIGTTGPSVSLQIVSSLPRIYLGTDEGKFGGLVYSTSTGDGSLAVRGQGNSTTAVIHVDAGNNQIRFDTNSSERMRITSGGNVGIGTTSPDGTLVLAAGNNGTASTGGYLGFTTGTNNSKVRGAGIETFTTDSSNNHGLRFYTNAAASSPVVRMILTDTGNVGIGTTSPTQRLDVNGLINSTNGICVGGEGVSRFWTGTQAAYDAITTKSSTTAYLIT
jgi:hypothetical protein